MFDLKLLKKIPFEVDSLLPRGKLAFSSLTLNISRALIFNNNLLHPSCARHGTRCWGDFLGPALVELSFHGRSRSILWPFPRRKLLKWSRKLGCGAGAGVGDLGKDQGRPF